MATRRSSPKSSRSSKSAGQKRSDGRGPNGKQAPKKRSVFWRFRRTLFLVGLVCIAGIAGAGFVLAQIDLPPEEPLVQSSFVCAADVVTNCGPDNAMAKLSGEQDRVSVPLEEMPQVFIDAVLAAEDRQFFSHAGIDPLGIVRALYQDLRNQGATQGGSTITQQYAKNKFLSSERTVARKLKEAVLAIKLERELTKAEILQRYLNTVYFGRGAYGAEAAARAYFGISIRAVGIGQSAYLAGLIRSPESADASRDPQVATFRRNSVLDGMVEIDAITEDERDAAKAVPIGDIVAERGARDGLIMLRGAEDGSNYYMEYVRRLLYDKYGAERVNGGGLRVYTALDPDLQAAAYDAVWDFLTEPDDPAGALVSVDHLGRVVAMVGGKDFEESQVNLALGSIGGGSGRQPGSSFKPVVLAAALEQGLSVESKFLNANEMVFPKANAGEDWKVSNYSAGTEDVVDLVEATRISSNTVFAQLMIQVGPAAAVRLARDLGIESELPVVNSLVLGSGEVSPLDMASAYSTFARRGEAIEPIIITRVEQIVDGEVEVLESASTKAEQVLAPTTADQVNWILRQVATSGTAAAVNFGPPIAAKTGTTQDYRDAWLVGYTPKLTTAVWMGFPDPDENGDPRFMRNVRGRRVTGGSFPAQIWRAYMEKALAGEDHGTFPTPQFGGRILNSDLTTSTVPYCTGDEAAGPGPDGVTTTVPCTPPPPECTGEEAEGAGDDGVTTTVPCTPTTTSSSTSTTRPPTTRPSDRTTTTRRFTTTSTTSSPPTTSPPTTTSPTSEPDTTTPTFDVGD